MIMGTTRSPMKVRERALEVIILILLSPFAWWLADRDPPWVRLKGYIAPTPAGTEFVVDWTTTPLVRECKGQIQIEIISGYMIWPVLRRQINPALVVGMTHYVTPPWVLDSDVPPGKTTYRVTTFWYCNWLQEVLHIPVIQVGPEIEFETLPRRRPA